MAAHPCEKGLTPACFASYHKWAKQALAYKLTRLLLPKELTRRLPEVLRSALIGPGAILPPGLILPPGAIVPPGFTWPDHWTPWQYFDFTTLEDPRTLFPPGWTPGDPLPPGVTLPPGYVLPPGWTPIDPPPPAFIPGYSPFPTPPDSGAAPPIFIPPFEPGPVHVPSPGPGAVSYQETIKATSTGRIVKGDDPWASVHDALSGTSTTIPTTDESILIHVRRQAPMYYLFRGFFKFSLATIPAGAVITAASLSLFGWSTYGATISLQQAPTCGWLSNADFDSFYGPETSRLLWAIGENKFSFNAALLAYLQSNIGSNVYFCARESLHDYDNVAPAEGETVEQYFHNHNAPDPATLPALAITYKA